MSAARLLSGATLAGFIEGYQFLEWTRPYLQAGSFRLEMIAAHAAALNLTAGLFVEPPGEAGLIYVIEQIERDRTNVEHVILSGRDLGGYLLERDCVPPATLMHDALTAVSAEAAMKHYVNVNAGPGAPLARQIPNLTIAANQNRPAGSSSNYQARYQYVADMLAEIGTPAALGWEVRLNYGTGKYVFDVIAGVNRATGPSNDRVFFDFAFDTAIAQNWVTGNLGRKNVARVLGQGEGAARTVVVTWLGKAAAAAEPVGFDRRELVVDARDLTATADLERRGQAKLAETQSPDAFAIEVNPYGSFRYRADWDLGDLVVVRNQTWGIATTGRIVGVTSTIEPQSGNDPQLTIEVGRSQPTLAAVLRGGTLGNGSSLD